MKRPRILLDIDGVAADFLGPCLQTIYDHLGILHTPDAVTDWDIMKSLGISDADAHAVYKAMETQGLCLNLPVYPGAVEGVKQLRDFADVWAVTSPFGGSHWMHERDQWLVEKLGFHKDHVLHVRSNSKYAITGDALVEDKTSTLMTWQEYHPDKLGVLFMRNYNLRDGWTGAQAADWPSLVQLLESYFRRKAEGALSEELRAEAIKMHMQQRPKIR